MKRLLVLFGFACLGMPGAEPERWFMPGPLGHEPAVDGGTEDGRPRTAAGRGFGVRVFDGLRRPEEIAWRQAHGISDTPDNLHGLYLHFGPKLHAEHPEFFPLVEGKRYVPRAGSTAYNPDLGRPDVAAYTARQVQGFFAANPGAPFCVLGINDGLIFGESPETLALLQPPAFHRGRPDYSPLVFTFMNRVAAATAETHPDKYLACLAYYWAENAPPFPVDPHVLPFVAVDRSQVYDAAYARGLDDLHQRWAEAVGSERRTEDGEQMIGEILPGQRGAGNADLRQTTDLRLPAVQRARYPAPPRLGYYDYLFGNGFVVPRVPVRAFTRQLQEAHRLGFTDYFAEVSPNWGLAGPLPWVMAQLLEDPTQNVDLLLEEYYARFWRTAAEPMRTFFERCEAQWMGQPGPGAWLKHYRNESQAALFPPEVCAQLRLLLEAATRAAAGDATLEQRVAFVADSFRVTERFADLDRSRQEVARFALQPGRVTGAATRVLTRYLNDRVAFNQQLQQTTARWPLAFFPNPWHYDDFLRHHPAFPAALVLAREGLTHDLRSREEGEIRDALAVAAALKTGALRELARNGALTGPIVKGRRIAGLAYAADLPAPWLSQVEPTQTGVAEIEISDLNSQISNTGTAGTADPARVLRISGAANSTVFQWVRVEGGQLYLAAVEARGRVSSGNATTFTLGWLNAQQQPIGKILVARLPDGTWPDWVTLTQGGRAPDEAAWAGLGVRVQTQLGDDTAEFRHFSLKSPTVR